MFSCCAEFFCRTPDFPTIDGRQTQRSVVAETAVCRVFCIVYIIPKKKIALTPHLLPSALSLSSLQLPLVARRDALVLVTCRGIGPGPFMPGVRLIWCRFDAVSSVTAPQSGVTVYSAYTGFAHLAAGLSCGLRYVVYFSFRQKYNCCRCPLVVGFSCL